MLVPRSTARSTTSGRCAARHGCTQGPRLVGHGATHHRYCSSLLHFSTFSFFQLSCVNFCPKLFSSLCFFLEILYQNIYLQILYFRIFCIIFLAPKFSCTKILNDEFSFKIYRSQNIYVQFIFFFLFFIFSSLPSFSC